VSSFKPSQCADQVKSGEVVSGGFFVASCDTSEVFDCIEESFDEIALAVEREITVAFDLAVGLGRDDWLDGAPFQAVDERVAVVGLVGEERCGRDLSGQRFGLRDVVGLSWGQAECQRISQSIDDDMDFRRQAASGTAYGLVLAFFFLAPALC
jgi:hypothetical protein